MYKVLFSTGFHIEFIYLFILPKIGSESFHYLIYQCQFILPFLVLVTLSIKYSCSPTVLFNQSSQLDYRS